jgi:hypothetical protein
VVVAQRTTIAKVQALLGDDYGVKEDGTSPDLQPFIDTATVITDRVDACATKKRIDLTDAELELIERWVAAHLYTAQDKPYSSRSTAGASGQFQGQTAMGYDSTRYGQEAQRIDYSGCLRNIDKQQRAGMAWLGKPLSSQIPYRNRN